MAVLSVNLGHWRALEQSWLKHFTLSSKTGTVAVVTAGNTQSRRLMSLVTEAKAGTGFYPGFPQLAAALAGEITSPPVSVPQRIALATFSGYGPGEAPAAADFFEKLIDKGITGETFHLQAQSMRAPDAEVTKTAGRFLAYHEKRKALHPFTPDSRVIDGPVTPNRFRTYIFYGYYDLNPGQRSYIRKLAEKAEILWFSPVHPSHPWREAFQRTLDFLKGLLPGKDFHRVDSGAPLAPMAQFAENMLTGKVLQECGAVTLKQSRSGASFTKAVTGEIEALMIHPLSLEPREIAVVARGRDARAIVTELHCAGIPCGSSLTIRASDLPWGNLVLRLNALEDNDFHHIDIQGLLATGAVDMPETPDPCSYGERVRATGARFGLDSLEKTGFPFTEVICEYYRSRPSSAPPPVWLELFLSALRKLAQETVPGVYLNEILTEGAFRSDVPVAFPVFRKMVEKAMEEPVKTKDNDPNGVAVIPPELARGALYPAIILTGMEEGSFPGRTENDPRLPVEMKILLQMPSPDNRETEEAFILRQIFEGASEKLIILARNQDRKGNAIPLSPFLTPLGETPGNHRPVTAEIIKSTPRNTLDFPAEPPFLRSSLTAQRERLFFNENDPSPDAVHCGMIGPGYTKKDRISATMLEAYSYDEFSYLTGKVWRVEKPEPFPVSSKLPARTGGTVLHACVQRALGNPEQVEKTVWEEGEKGNITALLGTPALAELWTRHTVEGIKSLLQQLEERGWSFQAKEVYLTGVVAGYEAYGFIDLIFKDGEGGIVVADLKTGSPKKISGRNILKEGLFQLPFYSSLAEQNGISPVNVACYIHLESNGRVTFREVSAAELRDIHEEFEMLVRDTVDNIHNGRFPMRERKVFHARG